MFFGCRPSRRGSRRQRKLFFSIHGRRDVCRRPFRFCLLTGALYSLAQSMESLPGFRDFYPEPLPQPDLWSADVRQYIFDKWRGTARRYGFREYDGPPLEPLELFTTKSGEEIEIGRASC